MSNEDLLVYVATKNLQKAGGKDYKRVLKDLIDNGIIKSFEDVTAICVDKSKALHIEAVLEGFYDAPITTTFQQIKGDK
jgi:hypothetical protein